MDSFNKSIVYCWLSITSWADEDRSLECLTTSPHFDHLLHLPLNSLRVYPEGNRKPPACVKAGDNRAVLSHDRQRFTDTPKRPKKAIIKKFEANVLKSHFGGYTQHFPIKEQNVADSVF